MDKLLYTVLISTAILCTLCSQVFGARIIYVDADSHRGVNDSSCWDGGPTLPCLTFNLALEGMKKENSTTVFVEKGTYDLSPNPEYTTFSYMTNLAIVGNDTLHPNSSPEVHVFCEAEAGLTFINSVNITIRNVLFSGCGAIHDSTSKNFTAEPFSFLQFHAALYFLFCKDVILFQTEVSHSNGIGVVMYSTIGTNLIQYSNFSFNREPDNSAFPGGGGLYIEFPYCIPGDLNCSNQASDIPSQYLSDSHYKIDFSVFYNNTANIIDQTNYTFILPQKSNHLAFGRGGGLSVFFKGHAMNNTITINQSRFDSNQALWGAGVFVEYQDYSQSNSFEVYSSEIESNICYHKESPTSGTGGGGSRVGFIFFNDTHAHSNHLAFDDCLFQNNEAYFGGGLSLYAAREPTESTPTNSLQISNTRWISNVARAGSGVDFSVWHSEPRGAVVKPRLVNCSFRCNSASYTHRLGSLVGIGAMYLDSIPVVFSDAVIFENNNDSALAAVNTGIYFANNSTGSFANNSGRNGGAIALMGFAFVETSGDTFLNFTNNRAELKGGAIYAQSVGEHDLISSRNCFIRYNNLSATPDDWTSEFYFDGNTAKGKNNSIYATSLLTCLWGGAYGSTEESAKKTFCWKTWRYSSGSCTAEIATSPAMFSKNNSAYFLSIIPGQQEGLPISMYDDRGAIVTNETVFLASTINGSIQIDSNSQYISDNSIRLYGTPATEATISLETVGPRVLFTKLIVNVQQCPPGMILVGSGNNSRCKCQGDYAGHIQCSDPEFQSKLQRGGWMGYYNHRGKQMLLAGECPYCASIAEEQYFLLPQNVSALNDSICGKLNRRGVLCGKCEDGYGPVVNSDSFKCKNCSASETKYHWAFYLLTEFLTITIFFIIIVFFNIGVTSAPANAFIFFAQILTTTLKIDGDGAILLHNVTSAASVLKDVYTVPYDIWNLNFFRPIMPEFCLSPHISTLQMLTLGYVTAAYPLILILIFSAIVWLYEGGVKPILCLCRPVHEWFATFRRKWNLNFKRSIIDAFATFLLLSYTKFTLVSLILLTGTPLFDNTGKVFASVLYYDGTIDYMSKQHTVYVISAILVLLTFVAIPPVILIVPSGIRNLEKILGRKLCNIQPGAKLQQFLNAFQGGYKDGTEDRSRNTEKSQYDFRFFAGLYFVLRIILFLVYAFTPEWFMQFTLQQIVFMIAFLLFALFRPYKDDFYNKLDASIFVLLSGINTLTIYNYYFTILHTSLSVWAFTIQYILIFTPLIYMAGFLIVRFWQTCGERLNPYCPSIPLCCKKPRVTDEPEEDDFLAFADANGRLAGVNSYRRPSSATVSNDEETAPLVTHDSLSTQGSREQDYGATSQSHQRNNATI